MLIVNIRQVMINIEMATIIKIRVKLYCEINSINLSSCPVLINIGMTVITIKKSSIKI